MTTYQGSCHCGKIAYEFESGPIAEGMECNCSMCGRKGVILHFIPDTAFALKTPRENVSTYKFNKHNIAHHFCATCGTAPFSEGTDAEGNKMVAINLRCVDGVDLRALKVKFHNGIAD